MVHQVHQHRASFQDPLQPHRTVNRAAAISKSNPLNIKHTAHMHHKEIQTAIIIYNTKLN